jgi:hypothetical protein
MPRIDDVLEDRPTSLGSLRVKPYVPHLDGLPVSEVINALQALEKTSEVRDKRVLSCRIRNPGEVVIQTGWAHGGCNGGGDWVLLVKGDDGWRVDGVRWWRS